MRTVIIANGDPPTQTNVQRWLRPHATLICADGGARAALHFGLRPHHCIGDFDSLSPDELQQLEKLGTHFHRHPPAKDETDLELALLLACDLFAQQGSGDTAEIVLLGAMGGRIDQEMANLMLLALPRLQTAGVRVRVVHKQDDIELVDARLAPHEWVVHGAAGDTVSLLPFGGDAFGIRTEGLQYALHNETLFFGPARGVSNVMLSDTARVQVQRGMVLGVHSQKDE